MSRWVEIRDKLPPLHMQVLLYIRDEIDGYTEDYCCQGSLIEIENPGTYDRKIKFSLCGGGELASFENVAYWTLLPEPPISWK